MKIVKSESTVSPQIIDTTSSKTKVYVRSNIVEEVREDCTMFVYDEIQYTNEEWADIRLGTIETTSDKIVDALAISLGVTV